MSLRHSIKLINKHPLTSQKQFKTYLRIIKWQLAQAILRQPMVMPFVNDSILLVEKGMTGATGNIYFGLHEFNDMGFLLHFLNEEDVFFDVGANIGSYTVLSSKVCGAKSFSFEPSKITYERLSNNIFLNRIDTLVTPFNLGVSEKSETLNFSTGFDTVNHVTAKEMEYTEKIDTISLNEVCKTNNVIPNLLKIDVEGFEFKVIAGASELLGSDQLNAIIIELNGSGPRYGFNEDEIHNTLTQYNYSPYFYNPISKCFHRLEKQNKIDNTLYIKNIEIAKKKVSDSKSYKIMNTLI
ncbi:FkbM family methyltransferase [Vicingaceae bacterium]|nr:FkbM family methyltransferase [Vicingaceae bacterium]